MATLDAAILDSVFSAMVSLLGGGVEPVENMMPYMRNVLHVFSSSSESSIFPCPVWLFLQCITPPTHCRIDRLNISARYSSMAIPAMHHSSQSPTHCQIVTNIILRSANIILVLAISAPFVRLTKVCSQSLLSESLL